MESLIYDYSYRGGYNGEDGQSKKRPGVPARTMAIKGTGLVWQWAGLIRESPRCRVREKEREKEVGRGGGEEREPFLRREFAFEIPMSDAIYIRKRKRLDGDGEIGVDLVFIDGMTKRYHDVCAGE